MALNENRRTRIIKRQTERRKKKLMAEIRAENARLYGDEIDTYSYVRRLMGYTD